MSHPGLGPDDPNDAISPGARAHALRARAESEYRVESGVLFAVLAVEARLAEIAALLRKITR